MAESELPYKEIFINHKGSVVTVLVDAEDYPLLSRHTWYIRSTTYPNPPYAATTIHAGNGKQEKKNLKVIPMHQIIMGVGNIDHRNFNTLDNRKNNLRKATHQQNGWNKGKPRRSGYGKCTSRYKGVVKYTNSDGNVSYNVIIKLTAKGVTPAKFYRKNGFTSEIEAAKDYNREIVKHRGKFAWLNPIEEYSRKIDK